jgi:metallo-beta-lactamase class B
VSKTFIASSAFVWTVAVISTGTALAQGGTPDHPVVSFEGKPFTPLSIVTRNMGSEEDQTTAFPPHKIIDNIYYVGTKTLSSFLVATPAGHILMNSTYERNVPTIRRSIEQLGFKFADIKIIIGNHAHGDHMEGDALVKELTGGMVMAMTQDVPALRAIKPGGKEHPIDRLLHDGDTVAIGGSTLVAHLTPGHTHGCTTWTTSAREDGKTYDIVFGCSLRAPAVITPDVADEFTRSFQVVDNLPCDVLLGDHPAQFDLAAKYSRMQAGGSNPFIDRASCHREAAMEKAMFNAILAEQAKSAAPKR